MTTKFQIGDKIHIECEIVELPGYHGCNTLSARHPQTSAGKLSGGYNLLDIHPDNPAIVKHIPKPWVPEVGSRVRGATLVGVIKAIDGEYAWVKWDCSKSAGNIWTLTSLERE